MYLSQSIRRQSPQRSSLRRPMSIPELIVARAARRTAEDRAVIESLGLISKLEGRAPDARTGIGRTGWRVLLHGVYPAGLGNASQIARVQAAPTFRAGNHQ